MKAKVEDENVVDRFLKVLSSIVADGSELTAVERKIVEFYLKNDPFPTKCFLRDNLKSLCSHMEFAKDTAYVHRRHLRKKGWVTPSGHLSNVVKNAYKQFLDNNTITILVNEKKPKN